MKVSLQGYKDKAFSQEVRLLGLGLRSRLYLPNEGSLASLLASVVVRTSNLQVARVDSRLPSRCDY